MELRIHTRRKTESIFAPCLLFFVICSFVGEGVSRRHNNSSKQQQQSQPNIIAMAVIEALGRSLYFHLFPSRLLACQRSF